MSNLVDCAQASSCYNFITAINIHSLTSLTYSLLKLIIHYRENANPSAPKAFPCWKNFELQIYRISDSYKALTLDSPYKNAK